MDDASNLAWTFVGVYSMRRPHIGLNCPQNKIIFDINVLETKAVYQLVTVLVRIAKVCMPSCVQIIEPQ